MLPFCTMDHISALLPKVLAKRGIKGEADASHVVFGASQWLREKSGGLAGAVAATKFTMGTLILEVRSSVVAQECMGLTEELLKSLQKRFPGVRIERIRILRATRAEKAER